MGIFSALGLAPRTLANIGMVGSGIAGGGPQPPHLVQQPPAGPMPPPAAANTQTAMWQGPGGTPAAPDQTAQMGQTGQAGQVPMAQPGPMTPMGQTGQAPTGQLTPMGGGFAGRPLASLLNQPAGPQTWDGRIGHVQIPPGALYDQINAAISGHYQQQFDAHQSLLAKLKAVTGGWGY